MSNGCLCERFSCYSLKTRGIPSSSLFLSVCIQTPCSQNLVPVCSFSVYSWYAATILCMKRVCFQNFLLSLLLLKEHWNGQILCLFLCVSRFESVTCQNKFLFFSALKQQPLYYIPMWIHFKWTPVMDFFLDYVMSSGWHMRIYSALHLKHTVHALLVLMAVSCLAIYFVCLLFQSVCSCVIWNNISCLFPHLRASFVGTRVRW